MRYSERLLLEEPATRAWRRVKPQGRKWIPPQYAPPLLLLYRNDLLPPLLRRSFRRRPVCVHGAPASRAAPPTNLFLCSGEPVVRYAEDVMTKVEMKVELSRPLDEDLMARVADAHGIYGLAMVKLNPSLDSLTVHYDASRLSPMEVEAALAGLGLPIHRHHTV
jgi:hypothetical protein